MSLDGVRRSLPLRDAVAAANLLVVGHGGEVRTGRLAATGLGKGAAENEPVAQGRRRRSCRASVAGTMAVGDIAVEHGADQLAVAQHDLLVEAAVVVAQRDLVVALVGRHQRAGRKHIDAGDLEAGR